MTLEEWRDELSSALQGDLEHGVRWLNERAAERFKQDYPALSAWVTKFMRAEVTSSEAGAVHD